MNEKKSLLIVEDDCAIRSVLAELLTAEGYDVLMAEHGEHAFAILDGIEVLPSLILLDLSMPVMDGRTFLRTIDKKRQVYKQVPVVVMTAARHTEIPAHFGVKMVLKKPLDVNHLMDTIERTIYIC